MIQLQLPDEMSNYFDDIKVVREKNLEPISYKQIVIDAVKDLHKKCVPQNMATVKKIDG